LRQPGGQGGGAGRRGDEEGAAAVAELAADLGGARLEGASFLGCWLPGADFTRARLARARFALSALGGAVLDRVTGLDEDSFALSWVGAG
jgi:uncharacterized protein YjbI with pentapeptide repeats